MCRDRISSAGYLQPRETEMATQPRIRPATSADAAAIIQVLQEVADWLIQSDMPMWKGDELDPGQIVADVTAGRYYLAEHFGVSAGVMRFQLEDPLFWPEMPPREAAYVHRLAVRRGYAGQGVSTALLARAVENTHALGRRYLRLDCEASRPRLRQVYEAFGFIYHSDKLVGPYHVARYQYELP